MDTLSMPTPDHRKDATPREPPSYYNDLNGSLAHAWAMIERGAADRRAAFHTPVVATVDPDGLPAQRIMVLRAADGRSRSLRLHTDVRSEKLIHLARQPRASVLMYDAHAKLQLRLAGTARVHVADDVARAAWAASLPQGRLCYEQPVAPGAPIAVPLPELPVDQRFAAGDAGQVHFAAVVFTVDRIEWLYLAIEGHRRAQWSWREDRWHGTWLAP